MVTLLAYFALAIVVSFLCSLLEAILLSLTPSYISAVKEARPRVGGLLERLKRSVDRPLAAILSLNTIAHTVGAAGVGAQAQVVFQNLPLSVISGVLTLLILVFSEIIPKTLGAVYWRFLAIPAAYVLRFVILLMYPLVEASQLISRLISRHGDNSVVSHDEIYSMADLGKEAGILDRQDVRFLHSAMDFKKIKVSNILTPRPVVEAVHIGQTVRDLMQGGEPPAFSRFPVLEGIEGIKGYVMRDDILAAAARDDWELPVESLIKKMLIIPEQMPVKSAFSLFLRRREHIAAVVDEFGGFAGIITLEDVLETLIGHEIMDEGDTVEDMRAYARGNHHQTEEI